MSFYIRFYSPEAFKEEILRRHDPQRTAPYLVRKSYVTGTTQLEAKAFDEKHVIRAKKLEVILSMLTPGDHVCKMRLPLSIKEDYDNPYEHFEKIKANYEERLEEVFKDLNINWVSGEYVSEAEK